MTRAVDGSEHHDSQRRPWTPVRTAMLQGCYYLTTGVWPLVHMRSFVAVTGPKREPWLVRTVGVLVGAIGVGLIASASRRRVTPEMRLLSALAAAGLIAVEVPTVARGRIRPVYLLDALVEAGFVAAVARPEEDGEGR